MLQEIIQHPSNPVHHNIMTENTLDISGYCLKSVYCMVGEDISVSSQEPQVLKCCLFVS